MSDERKRLLGERGRYEEWHVGIKVPVDLQAISTATRFLLHSFGAEFNDEGAYFFWREEPRP